MGRQLFIVIGIISVHVSFACINPPSVFAASYNAGSVVCETERTAVERAQSLEKAAYNAVNGAQRRVDSLVRRLEADQSRVDKEYQSCQLRAISRQDRENERLARLETRRLDLIADAQELVVEAGLCLTGIQRKCNRDQILKMANRLFAKATETQLRINQQRTLGVKRLEFEQQRCDALLNTRHAAVERSQARVTEGQTYLAQIEAQRVDATTAREGAEAVLAACIAAAPA